jgi:2-succinyl-6-hydroxy-2,4-cyclohexadiene-1-carboxylate synthase
MADPAPQRIILVHGFTQTAASWETFAALLGDRLPNAGVVAVDLPGHGSAGELRADLWESADHLVRHGGRATYVGYSMGGRVAPHAVLAHPEFVERLILIGATAGIDDDDERRARRRSDEELATRIETIGVEAFIDEWLANPLFAGLTPATAQRADRLRNTAAGLASSLRSTGTGRQEPLWERLATVNVPALILAGAADPKFSELGRRLRDTIPGARFEQIDGAGHSVHLERPEATADAIAGWLPQEPRSRPIEARRA